MNRFTPASQAHHRRHGNMSGTVFAQIDARLGDRNIHRQDSTHRYTPAGWSSSSRCRFERSAEPLRLGPRELGPDIPIDLRPKIQLDRVVGRRIRQLSRQRGCREWDRCAIADPRTRRPAKAGTALPPRWPVALRPCRD